MKKFLKGSKTAWNSFLKPAINAAASVIGMAVGAISNNPKGAQATAKIVKSISGGKILTLIDNYGGDGLRLRVM